MSQQLQLLLSQADALPSAPDAVLRLAQTFENDDASTADVVEAVEGDPVLVAQLLRLANSPLFYRGRLIDNPSEAVRLIGLSKVRALVIGMVARDAFPGVPETALQQFWRVSLMTAELARHIAGLTRAPVEEDTAYLGGLLHMLGELAMRVAVPERMAELDARVHVLAPERAKEEVRTFSYSYAEIGAEIARRWRLPLRVVRIVEKQRDLTLKPAQDADVMAVQLAGWRARAIESGLSPQEQAERYPASLGKLLGIEPGDVLGWQPPDAGTDPDTPSA